MQCRHATIALLQELLATQHGLPPDQACVSLRSYGGADGGHPALIAFVRLDAWRPDVLLRGPRIERELREAVRRRADVHLGYVFWRVASGVVTPADADARVPARATPQRRRLLELAAQNAGAAPAPDAPVTDWADIAATLPMELPDRLRR